jgi:hypothetical protein
LAKRKAVVHDGDPLKKDFRKFAYVVLKHLGMNITAIQYDMCQFIQTGPKRRQLQAFRGISKSTLLNIYVCWLLYCDPQHKILMISATGGGALDNSQFVLQLLRDVPILQHLNPRDDQRGSNLKFDVNGAIPAKSPSVRSSGIDGQITGARADTIVVDDLEIPTNSDTEGKRIKLAEKSKELAAILNPGVRSQIVVLGTPQTEDSIYPKMENERNYAVRIWPALFPTSDERAFYGDRLSRFIADKLDADPALEGSPTESERFSPVDMQERLSEYGRSGFALQFQLDTRLGDKLRYPLRLSDLIVMECNAETAPEKPIWATSPELVWNDLYNPGLNGDRMYRPMRVQGDFIAYTHGALHIDPSGRGRDELGFCVTKMLNGFIYTMSVGGLTGGYDETNLRYLVSLAKRYAVREVQIEANFGDGMFTKIIAPYFSREYPVTITEVKHNRQKELRIIDTLEPVMNQHRLVISAEALRKDHETAESRDAQDKRVYTLTYQLTHITKDRGSLIHDDRLDALAMAVAYWQDLLQKDADKMMVKRRSDALDEEIKKFMKAAGKTYGTQNERRYIRMR